MDKDALIEVREFPLFDAVAMPNVMSVDGQPKRAIEKLMRDCAETLSRENADDIVVFMKCLTLPNPFLT